VSTPTESDQLPTPSGLNLYGLSTVATARRPSPSSGLKIETSPPSQDDYFSVQPEKAAEGLYRPPSPAPLPSTLSKSQPSSPSKVANILNSRRSAFKRTTSSTTLADVSPVASTSTAAWQPPNPTTRRQRSRHNTRVMGGDQLPVLAMSAPQLDSKEPDSPTRAFNLWHSFEPLDVLMTPTTEEWRSYGGGIGSNRLKVRSASSRSIASSEPAPQEQSEDESEDDDSSDSGYEQIATAPSQPASPALSLRSRNFRTSPVVATSPKSGVGLDAGFKIDQMRSYIAPNKVQANTSLVLIDLPTAPSEEAVPLSPTGPVDPRQYSVLTKARNFNSFFIQGSAGQGGYGSVVRARERSPDGWSTGVRLLLAFSRRAKLKTTISPRSSSSLSSSSVSWRTAGTSIAY
jgi:hypothetical protein